MKTTFVQTYHDDDLADKVESEHAPIRNAAAEEGKDMAALEKPGADESVGPYIAKYRSRYWGLQQMVDAHTQATVNLPAGRTDTELAKEATADTDKEIATAEHAIGIKRLDMGRADSPIAVPLKAIGMLLITVVAFTADSLWTGAAFQLTGESRTRAVIIALGISMIMALFASSAAWLIQYWRKRSWKVITGVVAFAIATVVYYTIGKMRANFLAANPDNVGVPINTSPWFFAILNLAVFIALGLLALRFLPSLGQISAYNKRRRDKRELARLMRTLKALKEKRMAIAHELAAKLELRARVMEFTAALKRRIALMYLETCQGFIEANLLRRRTRGPADMYGEVPSLTNEVPQTVGS